MQNGRMKTRWCLPVAVVATSLPSPSPAADAPGTAYSASVLTPVQLLEDAILFHQFPQLGSSLPTEVHMSAASASFGNPDIRALGANGRWGGQSAFLLSHDEPVVSSSNLLQAGFGGAWGAFRAGLAGRGSRFRDTNEDTDRFSDDSYRTRFSETVVEHGEVALGVGWSGGRAFLDLLGELQWNDGQENAFEASFDDTTGFDLDVDPSLRPRIAARWSVPVAAHTDLLGYATFQDASFTADLVSFVGGAVATNRLDDYGHRWEVAVAVTNTPRPSTLTRVHAAYRNVRPGPAYDALTGFSPGLQTRRTTTDVVQLGFSLERAIWWDLRFLAGLQAAFTFTDTSTRFESPDESRLDDRTTESLSQAFAWGLHRSFDPFVLTASVRTDLQLLEPIVALDARLRL